MALYEVMRGMIKVGGVLYKKGDNVELSGKDEEFFTKKKKGKVKKPSLGATATERAPSASSKSIAKKFLKKDEGKK